MKRSNRYSCLSKTQLLSAVTDSYAVHVPGNILSSFDICER